MNLKTLPLAILLAVFTVSMSASLGAPAPLAPEKQHVIDMYRSSREFFWTLDSHLNSFERSIVYRASQLFGTEAQELLQQLEPSERAQVPEARRILATSFDKPGIKNYKGEELTRAEIHELYDRIINAAIDRSFTPPAPNR